MSSALVVLMVAVALFTCGGVMLMTSRSGDSTVPILLAGLLFGFGFALLVVALPL